MASTWIYVGLAVLVCLCSCTWAAPSINDLGQFGELERTLKELANTMLRMTGALVETDADASASSVDAANFRKTNTDLMDSNEATAMDYLSRLQL